MGRALIVDFNRTLFNPDSGQLYDGASAFLESASASRDLFLYSKREGGRDSLLNDLGIAGFFKNVYFADKKDAESIRSIIKENGLTADQCYVIGDLITSELLAGHEAGVDTIWVRQGKFADQKGSFAPTHTVHSLEELHRLVDSLD